MWKFHINALKADLQEKPQYMPDPLASPLDGLPLHFKEHIAVGVGIVIRETGFSCMSPVGFDKVFACSYPVP